MGSLATSVSLGTPSYSSHFPVGPSFKSPVIECWPWAVLRTFIYQPHEEGSPL